jgi:DNA-binding MurR/RpiR family transcriptional regulator
MVERMNVLSLINTSYMAFTKSEKKVADYVLKDPESILYSSVTDVGEACDVGDATVLRFCRKLGFNGYQSFKMTLAQSIQRDEDDGKELSHEIMKKDSLQDVSKKILSININAMNETFGLLDYENIEKTIAYMTKAKRIVFFGVGASSITAMEAKHKFMRINPYVEASFDSHAQSMIASLMSEKEVAIAFSHSGSSKDTVDMLKTAKEAGSKTICITRYAKSPITQYADVVLLHGAKEGPLQGGAMSTKIAQLYLVDLLYAEYFRRTDKLSQHNKEKTAEAISDKLY